MDFSAGIAIAVPLVIFAPDIPSVIGGLIGGIVVYPVVARITGHYRRGRLTVKGIGTSTGNNIKYDGDNAKSATSQPDNLNPSTSTESSTFTQSKDVNKNQDNTTSIDKEDKKK